MWNPSARWGAKGPAVHSLNWFHSRLFGSHLINPINKLSPCTILPTRHDVPFMWNRLVLKRFMTDVALSCFSLILWLDKKCSSAKCSRLTFYLFLLSLCLRFGRAGHIRSNVYQNLEVLLLLFFGQSKRWLIWFGSVNKSLSKNLNAFFFCDVPWCVLPGSTMVRKSPKMAKPKKIK